MSTTAPNTALAQRRQALAVAAKAIDETSQLALEHFEQGGGSFAAELQVAQAMNDLRAILTPEVMQPVMALMNTDLGFRTDKDPNQIDPKTSRPFVPYSVDVVREVFIESKLRGFHAVGNEFNLIAGRFYGAKNGFRRKVTRFKGLTEFRDNYDVPRVVGDKGALVKVKASWKLNGITDSIECELPVKVNSFMGPDAMLGKAERKLLKRVHDRLTGMNTPDADPDDYAGGPTVDVGGASGTKARVNPDEPEAPADPPAEVTMKPRAARTQEAVDSAVVREKPPTPPLSNPEPQGASMGSTPQPDPEPEVLTQTPQAQVEKFLAAAGVEFADFIGWLVTTGGITRAGADIAPSCHELPAALCEDLLSVNARALRKCATIYGKK